MIKRLLVCFLFSSLLFNGFTFGSENNQENDYLVKYGIINGRELYGEKITRAECIISILRLIGLTDEIVKYCEEHVNMCDAKFDDSPNENYVYIDIADVRGIALGDVISKTKKMFYPDKAVTLKECLNFMIRCLHEEKSKYKIDDIMVTAKEEGLLEDSDTFLENQTLSYDDFYLLLNRMLYHQRGYYFDWKLTFHDEGYYWMYFDDKTEKYNDNYMRYIDYYKLYK